MKCGKCEYKTETEIPDTSSVAEKQQQLMFHREDTHPPTAQNVVKSPPIEDGRNKVKFPKPEVDQVQSLEEWETFLIRWKEYKKQMKVDTNNVSGQLMSCTSNELEVNLTRILGKDLYNESEMVLLNEMKKIVVKHQNPAVYVEEFLTTKQEAGEGVRHYYSRLKGISSRCEFVVTCTCCKKENRTCCDAKVSYADNITKFKLVSGLADSDIKEDALGLEVTTLDGIVKAVEVKESAKEANRTLGKHNGKINKVTRGGAS